MEGVYRLSDKTSNNLDEFDELFVDEDAVLDKNAIKEILKGYVQLTRGGGIIPNEDFQKLKNPQKIIIVLLAKKVFSIREGTSEETTPKEVENLTGIPRGSVTKVMPDLERDRIAKSKDGKYWIPNYSIVKVKEMFNGR